jgi:hypothetical protein
MALTIRTIFQTNASLWALLLSLLRLYSSVSVKCRLQLKLGPILGYFKDNSRFVKVDLHLRNANSGAFEL